MGMLGPVSGSGAKIKKLLVLFSRVTQGEYVCIHSWEVSHGVETTRTWCGCWFIFKKEVSHTPNIRWQTQQSVSRKGEIFCFSLAKMDFMYKYLNALKR